MKLYFRLLFVVFFFASAACSEGGGLLTDPDDTTTNDGDDPDPNPDPNPDPGTSYEEVAITFSASMISRASDSQFESGDQISVLAYDASGGIYAINSLYTYEGSLFSGSSPIMHTSEDQQLSYAVVYPYQTMPDDLLASFTVESDQGSGSNYTLSDLMLGYAASTSNTTPQLTFNHLLSRIVVNIISSDVELVDVVATLQAATTVEYNLTELTATSSQVATLNMASNGESSYKAIVAPHTVAANELFGEVWVNGISYELTYESDIVIAAGMSYEFDLIIEDNSISFDTPTINGWEDGEIPTEIYPNE